MAINNSIEKFKKYTTLLDEVFAAAAKTSVLESDASVAQQGNNANEIIIPKMVMDGLGNYDRQKGYPAGAVTLTTETVSFNYERGRMFVIDNMDNEESAGIAYGRLASEFLRTKVVPEADAVRFAAYAAKTKAANRSVNANYADGAAVHTALTGAMGAMDENEVPAEGRYLFITPTVHNLLLTMDTYKSKAILDQFAGVIRVPQSRFYSQIQLLSGADDDTNRAGGFKKTADGVNLNWMIVHKPTILQFTKHAAPKVVTPEQNQDMDAWKFGYRVYGLNDAYENKLDGLWVDSVSALA